MGYSDWHVKEFGSGRVENFDIAENEKLIGCKLDQNHNRLLGLRWMKMKVPKFKEQTMKRLKIGV